MKTPKYQEGFFPGLANVTKKKTYFAQGCCYIKFLRQNNYSKQDQRDIKFKSKRKLIPNFVHSQEEKC